MKSCLIVDDSRVVRALAREIVEGFSFDVSEATDGRQALAACEGTLPDVVLLDWNMPVMDGYEFLLALRGMPGGDRPYVIFCTSTHDFRRIEQAVGAGADEYVIKPFDREILMSKFAQARLID